jgi:hypothetical protein
MIDPDLNRVANLYREMSEPELMDAARGYDELAEPAQILLRKEFNRRSLEPPMIEEVVENVAESRSLVTIRKFRDLPEAFIARSVLENAGIECFLQDENTIRMEWLWSNMMGGARLQVAIEDETAATEALSQPIPASFAIDSEPDFVQPQCPKCGSLNVEPNDRGRKVAATSVMFLSQLFPIVVALPALLAQRSLYYSHAWKCSACECVWQYQDEAEPDADAPVN